MNGLKLASLAAFLAGAGLLGYAATQGQLGVSLVLFVVPVIHGTGAAAAFGMLLLFAAVVLWALGSMRDVRAYASRSDAGPDLPDQATKRRGGGFVLLGPIPIVWGDARSRRWMVVAGAVLLALWILAALWLRG